MSKLKIITAFIFVLLIFEIAYAQSHLSDSTKRKNDTHKVESQTELGVIWSIFYKGGALGICFLFCLYAYFELKAKERRIIVLQNQLIESYSKSSQTLTEEVKQHQTQTHRFLRVILNSLKNKKKQE